MRRKLYAFLKPFYLAYADGDVTPPPPPPLVIPVVEDEDLPADLKGKTTFTQAELNSILAESKRKHKTQVQNQIKELETLKRSQTLTEADKKGLQTRIDEMQNALLTKEELAKKERERLETTHKQTLQTVTEERDSWKTRFNTSMIETAIIGEASRAEAFDPDSLIAILGPNTRVIEEVEPESGKPTGKFAPKVKFPDTDASGKAIILDLSVPEVVKRMKEIPKYGYLFKSTANGGLGALPAPGSGGQLDFSKMTPEQYKAVRKQLGLT